MARRRRNSSRWWVLVVPALVALTLGGQHRWLLLACFAVVYVTGTAGIWALLFMHTNCDVITKTRGAPCSNPVRGRLRGCAYHRREKRAVWLSRVGIRGPLRELSRRSAPSDRRSRMAAAQTPSTTDVATVAKRGRDGFTMACTVVSTIGTVVSTAVAVIGLAVQVSGS